MPEPEPTPAPTPRRGGPPRAGLVAAVCVLLLVLVVALGTRKPPAPPPPAGPAATPNGPGTLAQGNAPPPSRAANAPAGNAPAANAAAANAPAAGNVPPPVNPSDLPPDHPLITSTDQKTEVSIQWFGYSCFYIMSPGGVAVVTDPFDSRATGLSKPGAGAHFVTVSEDTPQHGYAHAVHPFLRDSMQVLHGRPASRGDLSVTPVATAGRQGRQNFAYVVQAGPLRVVHLGALASALTPAQVTALGAVDILLVPVGEALPPRVAAQVVAQVKPRIVIPMAYATTAMRGPAARLGKLDAFVAAAPYAVNRETANIILISKPQLPSSTEIDVLQYAR